MDLKLFDFHLPTERIAQEPMRPRDHARLLHVPNDGSAFRDLHVDALPGLLKDGDVMVFNDTRVIPARLVGKRGDAAHAGKPEGTKIEVTLHQLVDCQNWNLTCFLRQRLNTGTGERYHKGIADVGRLPC